MGFWQWFLALFTSSSSTQRTFELDEHLVQYLQEQAEREQRSPQDLVSNLLNQALLDRRIADQTLQYWQSLTQREQEVAALLCLNYTNRQIALYLSISPETVKTHLRHIFRKFNINSQQELRLLLSNWDFSQWAPPAPSV